MSAFTFDGIRFTTAVPDFIQSFRLVVNFLNKSEPNLVESQKQVESENTCDQKFTCSRDPILPEEQGNTAIEEDKSDIDSDTDSEFTSCLHTESEVSDSTQDVLVNELVQIDGIDSEHVIGVNHGAETVLAPNIQQMKDSHLHLQLEPKVHVLRLPGFIVDSDEPANELEQIFDVYERHLFKDNLKMNWIFRPSRWS